LEVDVNQTLRGILKSKTINVNALVTVLLLVYLQRKGVDMDPEMAAGVVAGAYALINIVLRFFTDRSLPEKGIVLENPLASNEVVDAIRASKDDLDRLYDSLVWVAQQRRQHAGKR
jgi:hypothetical protein